MLNEYNIRRLLRWWNCLALIFLYAVLALASRRQAIPNEFETAVIRPTTGLGGSGTGVRRLGSRVEFHNYSLVELVADAYGVKEYRVVVPRSAKAVRLDIIAEAPPSVRLDGLHAMLRPLLAAELALTFHRELRPLPHYKLSVDSGGLKISVSGPVAIKNGENTRDGSGSTAKDREGFPIVPDFERPGSQFVIFGDGKASVRARQQSMTQVAKFLSSQLEYDVVNDTGLKDDYDFLLTWISERQHSVVPSPTTANPLERLGDDRESGPTLIQAVKQKLGLRLEFVKGPVEVIVVDHVSIPSGN